MEWCLALATKLNTTSIRAPSGRDPRLCGKVIQSTTLNIIKFVYETNNTFVTYKFEKHLWALKQRQNKNINERNIIIYV